jgi:Xaa-Pro aminopeptidase
MQNLASSPTTEFPEFEKAEYEARWGKAREFMAQEDMDALLITSEANYRYLSGHYTQIWANKFRPVFMVLPLNRDPILIVVASEESVAKQGSWITDIRPFIGFVAPGVDLIREAIAESELGPLKIGAELGVGQRMGMPYSDFMKLKEGLPRAEFVDASDLLWKLRLIKSEREIEYVRRAVDITNKAVKECFANLKEGMTERDVYRDMVIRMLEYGAERPGYIPVNADTGTPDRCTGGPTDRVLRNGNIIYMDIGCVYRGYWSDYARVLAIGKATDEQKKAYRIVYDTLQKCIRVIKPGTPVAEVMKVCLEEFDRAGVTKYTGRLGRIGHGAGLDLTEPPSINLEDPTVMEPGMVLYVEPNFLTDYGWFILEENLVVTEEGCEVLSEPADPELRVI